MKQDKHLTCMQHKLTHAKSKQTHSDITCTQLDPQQHSCKTHAHAEQEESFGCAHMQNRKQKKNLQHITCTTTHTCSSTCTAAEKSFKAADNHAGKSTWTASAEDPSVKHATHMQKSYNRQQSICRKHGPKAAGGVVFGWQLFFLTFVFHFSACFRFGSKSWRVWVFLLSFWFG